MNKFPCAFRSEQVFDVMFNEFLQSVSGPFGFICRGEKGSKDMQFEWYSKTNDSNCWYVIPLLQLQESDFKPGSFMN